jgi:predicted GTPase
VARQLNPTAVVIETASPVSVEGGDGIRGRQVLVVEDGPTVTHGGMPYGAGWIAAQRYGAAAVVDPRPYAVGSIRETFEAYPGVGPVLPAMGYGAEQVKELAATIEAVPADVVLIGTPIDLRRLLAIGKPALRVRYDLLEVGEPSLGQVLTEWVAKLSGTARATVGGVVVASG